MPYAEKTEEIFVLLFLSGLHVLVACGKEGNSQIVAIENESEYEEVVAKDVAYLYFGFDDCPYCKEFRPILEEELTETGQTAYYYNTKKRVKDVNYDEVLDTYGVAFVPHLDQAGGWKSGRFCQSGHRSRLAMLLAEE